MSRNDATNVLLMIGAGLLSGSVIALVFLAFGEGALLSLVFGTVGGAWCSFVTQVLLESE